MTESEAVKVCVQYNRELQKENERLRATQKESKIDRLLGEYLHWCRDYDPAGMTFAHIIAVAVLVGTSWMFALLVDYVHSSYLQRVNQKPFTEGYVMVGDTQMIDGKSTPCYQITFTRSNGASNRAAPCIVNRDEAFSVLGQLQELFINGKPKTQPEPSTGQAPPGR